MKEFLLTLCYLIKRALFKARKSRIFKILSLRPTQNVPKSSPLQKVSEGVSDSSIVTDLKIIYTRFGSRQAPVSLEIATKKVTKKGRGIFIKSILRLILLGFLLPRRNLLLSIAFRIKIRMSIILLSMFAFACSPFGMVP